MDAEDREKNNRGRHLSRPRLPFWGPLAAILDFEGGAGGERVPPSPLGWYSQALSLGHPLTG